MLCSANAPHCKLLTSDEGSGLLNRGDSKGRGAGLLLQPGDDCVSSPGVALHYIFFKRKQYQKKLSSILLLHFRNTLKALSDG